MENIDMCCLCGQFKPIVSGLQRCEDCLHMQKDADRQRLLKMCSDTFNPTYSFSPQNSHGKNLILLHAIRCIIGGFIYYPYIVLDSTIFTVQSAKLSSLDAGKYGWQFRSLSPTNLADYVFYIALSELRSEALCVWKMKPQKRFKVSNTQLDKYCEYEFKYSFNKVLQEIDLNNIPELVKNDNSKRNTKNNS